MKTLKRLDVTVKIFSLPETCSICRFRGNYTDQCILFDKKLRYRSIGGYVRLPECRRSEILSVSGIKENPDLLKKAQD